jgi:hypothetical protein
MEEADAEVRRLGVAKGARQDFDRREAWRHARLAEIDDGLQRHWAGAVLSAVREGDPLAYGEDRLRQARSTCAADLHRLERDQERERRGLGGEYGDTSQTVRHTTTGTSRAELSVVVAELDEALDGCEPSLVERSTFARSATEEGLREVDAPSHPLLHRDSGYGLGLGR